MSERNAPWSRGPCNACGEDILLARGYPTYGQQTCETCQVYTSAEADFAKRVAEVVADLRDRKMDFDRAYDDGDVVQRRAFDHALDLVAEKLGVTDPPKPPESA